jgi:hypothetical protein
MDPVVDVAVRQAIDLARARGGRLAAIALHGGDEVAVLAAARSALSRYGRADIEVRCDAPGGPVRVAAIEIDAW